MNRTAPPLVPISSREIPPREIPPREIPPRELPLRELPPIRRLVVKIGSGVLAPTGTLLQPRVAALASQLAQLHARGLDVVVVSSGAIASGYAKLGFAKPPKSISHKQAAAAVGQPLLMAAWTAALAGHGITAAQALYTADDLSRRDRALNTRRTLAELLARRAVPIVNENDTTSFAEIKLGDNDHLSALTASAIDADALLILSTARGLYEHNDPQRILATVSPDALAAARSHIATGTSAVGTGGFTTKLAAAALCARFGITTIVAGGADDHVITRVLAGEPLGTLFTPARAARTRARQRWLAGAARSAGTITVDAGAARAITTRNASLLPGGITAVHGSFTRDQTVDIAGPDGITIARGLSAYDADDARRIMGKKASQITIALGFCYADEVVHRSDMVVIIPEVPEQRP